MQFKICMGKLYTDKIKAAAGACIHSAAYSNSETGCACLDTAILSSVNHSYIWWSICTADVTMQTSCSYICECSTGSSHQQMLVLM